MEHKLTTIEGQDAILCSWSTVTKNDLSVLQGCEDTAEVEFTDADGEYHYAEAHYDTEYDSDYGVGVQIHAITGTHDLASLQRCFGPELEKLYQKLTEKENEKRQDRHEAFLEDQYEDRLAYRNGYWD